MISIGKKCCDKNNKNVKSSSGHPEASYPGAVGELLSGILTNNLLEFKVI